MTELVQDRVSESCSSLMLDGDANISKKPTGEIDCQVVTWICDLFEGSSKYMGVPPDIAEKSQDFIPS